MRSTVDAEIDLAGHRREYAEDGSTILHGAIPPVLLRRLRTAAEVLRELTLATEEGPRATRPPGGVGGGRLTTDFADRASASTFREFEEVPAVRTLADHFLHRTTA